VKQDGLQDEKGKDLKIEHENEDTGDRIFARLEHGKGGKMEGLWLAHGRVYKAYERTMGKAIVKASCNNWEASTKTQTESENFELDINHKRKGDASRQWVLKENGLRVPRKRDK